MNASVRLYVSIHGRMGLRLR